MSPTGARAGRGRGQRADFVSSFRKRGTGPPGPLPHLLRQVHHKLERTAPEMQECILCFLALFLFFQIIAAPDQGRCEIQHRQTRRGKRNLWTKP